VFAEMSEKCSHECVPLSMITRLVRQFALGESTLAVDLLHCSWSYLCLGFLSKCLLFCLKTPLRNIQGNREISA